MDQKKNQPTNFLKDLPIMQLLERPYSQNARSNGGIKASYGTQKALRRNYKEQLIYSVITIHLQTQFPAK